MQFSAKPLFENINVKFRNGNKYGLIGANGSGKSTFMKILDGSQTPSSGKVIIDENERVGKLNQNQFGFEEFKVIDTLITNFHAPKSTLLSIVQTIFGEKWRSLYFFAQSNNLKFLSFGDAVLFNIDE